MVSLNWSYKYFLDPTLYPKTFKSPKWHFLEPTGSRKHFLLSTKILYIAFVKGLRMVTMYS